LLLYRSLFCSVFCFNLKSVSSIDDSEPKPELYLDTEL
jgi:hypothetical protein